MTIFDLFALILALLAVFIAVFIKRPVIMPKIVFGKSAKESASLPIKDIDAELERAKLIVFQRDAKRRQKQRQAAKSRNRVKGRFA